MRFWGLMLLGCGLLSGCGQSTTGVSTVDMGAGAASVTTPTPLQKHVLFFDGNRDGVITVNETKAGLKALGMGSLSSMGAATLVHLGFRKPRIVVADIHQFKHGSDTGIYDKKGHLVPAAYERMWLFDKDRSGSLSRSELKVMLADNKTDSFGSFAARAEFSLLLRLAADVTVEEAGEKVPALSRARMAAFYDGSLLYRLAEERQKSAQRPLPSEDSTTLE